MSRFILKLSCPNQIGIVAAVSGFFASHRCNLVASSHFDDEVTDLFFMRAVFDISESPLVHETLLKHFEPIGQKFSMNWQIIDSQSKLKGVIMVSKYDHCLNDLLYRYRNQSIPMDIKAVISNHPDLKEFTEFYGIPYFHLPVNKQNKKEQEAKMLHITNYFKAEFVVLARYMQILTGETCRILEGKIINIHHSFLPSFTGAKPYHQAYDRGVKLIGATAHYVTEKLDDGPIIEQDTVRVNHTHTPEQLVGIGRDLENMVLARALKYHCEHRILLNGHKTVVFQ